MKQKNVLYKLTDTFYCAVPEESCCTCTHCSDVFWDYTNGIYMLICELNKQDGGKVYCEAYESDEIERPYEDDKRFHRAKRERTLSKWRS